MGTYELNITASNLVSAGETVLVTINVQNPVMRDHYYVTTDSPQGIDGSGTGMGIIRERNYAFLLNPIRDHILTHVAASNAEFLNCLEAVRLSTTELSVKLMVDGGLRPNLDWSILFVSVT